MRSGMAARFPTGDENLQGQPETDIDSGITLDVLEEFLAETIQTPNAELQDTGNYDSSTGATVLSSTSFGNEPIHTMVQSGHTDLQHSQEFLQEGPLEQSQEVWSDVFVSSDVALSGTGTVDYVGQNLVQDIAWPAGPSFPLEPGLEIPAPSIQEPGTCNIEPNIGPNAGQYLSLSDQPSYTAQQSYSAYQISMNRPVQLRTQRATATITRPPESEYCTSQTSAELSATAGFSTSPSQTHMLSSSTVIHSMQASTEFETSTESQGDFVEPGPLPVISQGRRIVASSKPQTIVPPVLSPSSVGLSDLGNQSKGLASQPLSCQIKEMRKTIVRHTIHSNPQESQSSSPSGLRRQRSPANVLQTSPSSPPQKFVFPPRPEQVEKARRSSSYSPGIISSSPQISPASTLSPSPSAYSTDRTSESQTESVRERLLETIQRRRGSVSFEEAELQEAGNQQSTPEERAKKAKRREQNRRAAQRCRQKKKQAADSVVGEFRKLQSCNTSLKQEIKKLHQQRDKLTQTLQDHLKECTWTTPQRKASEAGASTSTGPGEGSIFMQELPVSSRSSVPSGIQEDPDNMEEDSFDDSDTSDDEVL